MSFKSITNVSNPNSTTKLFCASLNLKGSALAVPSPSWLNNIRNTTNTVNSGTESVVIFASGTALKTDDITTADDSKYTFVNGGIYNVSYNVGIYATAGFSTGTADVYFKLYDASGVFLNNFAARSFVIGASTTYYLFGSVVSISKGFSIALASSNTGVSALSVVSPSMSLVVLSN